MMKEARLVRAISLAGVSLLTLYPVVGFADTDQITTTPGTTQTQTTAIGNTTGTTTTVDITGGGTEAFGGLDNTFSGGLSITGNSRLSLTGDSALGASTGTVTLGNGTSSGQLIFNNTSPITSNRNFILGGDRGIFTLDGSSVILNGTVSGAGELVLTGGGDLQLNGTNTYTGGTYVADNSTITLSSGSALGTGKVQLGGGASNASGGLTFTNQSDVTLSQDFVLAGSGGVFTLDGVTTATTPLPTTVTLTGTISGTGGLTLNAGGTPASGYQTLILSGQNTSTGPTTINSGILELGVQGGLNNGTLAYGNTTGTIGTGLTIGANGTFNMDGFNQSLAYLKGSGSIILGAGTLTLDVAGSNSVYDGSISGTGGLVLTGLTTTGHRGDLSLTLGGVLGKDQTTVNTYSGNTEVGRGATLFGGSNDAFSENSTIVIATGGTVNLNGYNQIIGGLSDLKGDTAPGIAQLIIGSANLTVGTDNANTVYSGSITGTGGFRKDGTGLLVLDGANQSSYTGNILVYTGGLEIGDSTHSTASVGGDVRVASAGTLLGYGTIGGSVENEGVVAPGGSTPGTLTIDGDYLQKSTATLDIRVANNSTSQLIVDGGAKLSGTLDLTGGFGKISAGNHEYEFIVDNGDDLTGSFTKIDGLLDAGYAESVACVSTGCTLTLTQLKTLNENASIYPALMTVAIDDVEHSNGMAQTRLNDARLSAVVDGMWMSTSDSHQPGANSNNTPYGLWGDFGGTFNAGVSGNGAALPGFSASGATTMSGVDGPIDKNVIGGVAAGYSYLNVSQQSGLYQKNGASGQVNAPHVSAYASYWTGPVAFDAILGVGYATLDATRSVNINDTTGNVFSSLNASATSTHSAIEVGGALQASSAFPIGGFGFSPAIGVQYANVLQQGFTEAGAGGFDVSTKSNQNQSLRPYVSLAAATKFETETLGRIEPQLKVAYSVETMNPGKSLNVQQGLTASRSAATVGAGVNIEVTRAFGYNVEYESSIGIGNATSQAVDAGVHYRF
jgi:outer membrane autotransporter protein